MAESDGPLWAEVPESLRESERQANRLRLAVLVWLMLLAGLAWGAAAAVNLTPRPVNDTVFTLIALGALGLAGAVVVTLVRLTRIQAPRKSGALVRGRWARSTKGSQG